jgi:hypothetical protein
MAGQKDNERFTSELRTVKGEVEAFKEAFLDALKEANKDVKDLNDEINGRDGLWNAVGGLMTKFKVVMTLSTAVFLVLVGGMLTGAKKSDETKSEKTPNPSSSKVVGIVRPGDSGG